MNALKPSRISTSRWSYNWSTAK